MSSEGFIQVRRLSVWRLIFRTVAFYWRSHLCLALAVAACTAVVAGALAVGDSMRHTLQTLAAQRIGRIGYALSAGGRLFRQDLADKTATVPVLSLPGIAVSADGTRRVNGIHVLGVDSRFAGLAPSPGFPVLKDGTAALNVALAGRLGAQIGDEILVRVAGAQLAGELAWVPANETARSFHARVLAIIPDDQLGRFALENTQAPPLNVYIGLSNLQETLATPGQVNLLLAGPEAGAPAMLNAALEKAWSLPDMGLSLVELAGRNTFELRSRNIFLNATVERAAFAVSSQAVGVISYLVNDLSAGSHATPYSFVAGLDPPPPGIRVAPGELVVTDWLAEDLELTNGAAVTMKFFVMGPLRTLIETSAVFRVGNVVPLMDCADPTLMPEMPGVSESASCRDWDSGVPINLARIRPKDEAYWETWRGAPKAYIDLETARSLWSNRWGSLTSIRYPATAGVQADLEKRLATELGKSDRPAFVSVRDAARKSWSHSMDFGQLFLGLSVFLVVSTVCMMALLFRLVAEQRIEQAGLLSAVGIERWAAHGWLVAGSLLASAAGGAIGLPAGLLYAGGLLRWFETLWQPAGTLDLIFTVKAASLGIAWGTAFMLALGTAWGTARRFREKPIRALLDRLQLEDSCRRRRVRHLLWLCGAGLALAMAGLAAWKGRGADSAEKVGFFFVSGACLLILGVGALRWFVDTWGMSHPARLIDRADLARRNAGRHPGRSVLIAGTLACAVFLLVVVVLFQPRETDPKARQSGTGGYGLMIETVVPISTDLNSPAGRKAYGLGERELEGVRFLGFRIRPGDDAGCGNLGRAQEPRLLGVDPEVLRARGAFTFLKVLPGSPLKGGEPWSLLTVDYGADVVPAVADETTLMWGLGKAVGDELTAVDESGHSFRLRVVGMLENSILQGSFVIAEEALARRYPSIAGHSLFLADIPAGQEEALADLLGRRIRDEGAAVTSCARRLAEGGAVTVMYLKLFQALGGLGLLLGVVVVALVVVRNAWERRGELALLRAVGYSRSDVAGLLVGEQVWLVGWGLAVGVVAALAAVGPVLDLGQLLSALWPGLALMLGAVAAGGMAASILAAWAVTRSSPVKALREE